MCILFPFIINSMIESFKSNLLTAVFYYFDGNFGDYADDFARGVFNAI